MEQLIGILTKPGEVYAKIKEDNEFVLPLVILIVAVTFYAASIGLNTDTAAVLQQQLKVFEEQGIPTEQSQAVVDMQSQIPANPVISILFGVVGGLIGFALIILIHALYLKIVSAVTRDGISYREWLTFCIWGRTPLVIGFVLVGIASYLIGPGLPESFEVLAIAQYVPVPSHSFASLLYSLDITLIWSLVVMTIGYKSWTQKSAGISAAIVFAPFVVIYAGLWLM